MFIRWKVLVLTNKQTNRRRWKHPTLFATLRRWVITMTVDRLGTITCHNLSQLLTRRTGASSLTARDSHAYQSSLDRPVDRPVPVALIQALGPPTTINRTCSSPPHTLRQIHPGPPTTSSRGDRSAAVTWPSIVVVTNSFVVVKTDPSLRTLHHVPN